MRRWFCCTPLALLTAAALGLAGCGSPATVSRPAASPSAPEMVFFKLTDHGYHAYDIPATVGQPVMLMVANHGTHPHQLHAAIPMATLQVDDPTSTVAAAPSQASSRFDVTVAPGGEVDVSFVPATPGRYPLAGDVMSGGALVVD